MKNLFFGLLCIAALSSYGQISVTGSNSVTSVANNSPAMVVDASLAITSSYTIPAFRVRITANFSSGDVLAYTGSLPSGVTASYASGTGILTFTGSSSAYNYQELLRTVTFTTTSASTSTRIITFEAGDGSLTYYASNGHYYNYISGSYTWSAAKTDAAAKTFFGLQGYLATVTSSAENTVILGLSGKGWLGGSDYYTEINSAKGTTAYNSQAAAENKWHWVTGPEKGTMFSNGSTAVTYANWNAQEPNNSGGSEHYVENAWAAGAWNDSQNSSSSGYVIEYGGSAGDASVDIQHSRTIIMVATELKTKTPNTGYSLHAAPVVVDPALTLYSTGNITDAKVTISGNFKSGDVLSYSGALPSGVTVSGTGYNTSIGVLSFSGTTTPSNWQALFRTVKFSSTSNSTGNRDITFSVGNQVANSNGHFYESVTTGASWATAKANAAAKTYMGLQGYLATITSASENDFIKQKIGTDAWIGLSDSYTEINSATGANTYASQSAAEGKWYWVTGPEKGTQITSANTANGSSVGTPVAGTYNNWNTGEPNNYSNNENFGEIYASGSAPGKWNDLNGTGNLMYVVEYGGLSSDPMISLSANTVIVNNSILPVTGLDFNAHLAPDAIDLKWSTVTEVNCDYFDVLHSADGIVYKKIATLKGHGTTDEKQKYQYVHRSPVYGLNFYKLQQFDIDGRYKYSPVKQINFGTSKTLLSPNPAHARITIFHSTEEANTSLIIYSMSGKVMHKSRIASEKTYVDIQSYPHGLYFAEIKTKSNSMRIMFVKQ